jgi:1-deoxy-D-xylulose-5-phosphate reductoisomerase
MPDMKGPIAYALSYPERIENVMQGLDLDEIKSLVFKKPDYKSFPCLSYAYMAMQSRGTMLSVLNAANEVAVDAFLKGMIRFTEISIVIRETMEGHEVLPDTDLAVILEADKWARKKAQEIIKTLQKY